MTWNPSKKIAEKCGGSVAATATLPDRWARLCQAPWRGAGLEARWSMSRVNGRPLLSFDAAALSKPCGCPSPLTGFGELIYLFEMGLQMI